MHKVLVYISLVLVVASPLLINMELPSNQTISATNIPAYYSLTTDYTINQAPNPGINNSNVCPTCNNVSSDLASQITSVVNKLIGATWNALKDPNLMVPLTIALVTFGLIVALRKKGFNV